ncbi:hypothetical protein [Nonomuraea rhodomycinica]|uniref:hypothetical protein n=1 Tax=Nonomuraea rhodomycinica TaxID=1712872 RepID=UPI001C377BF2|nr:hypothetical protein [Nonomuraea rhodomycinica]
MVEGIALHSFEGKMPFTPETLARSEQLEAVYGLTLTSSYRSFALISSPLTTTQIS